MGLHLWRHNDALFRWDLVDLDGDVRGWIVDEVIVKVPPEAQRWFAHAVYEQFGCPFPMRAFVKDARV